MLFLTTTKEPEGAKGMAASRCEALGKVDTEIH